MIKQLTKVTRLHKTELRDIKSLVDFSQNNDKFKTKLYWNILQDRQTAEFNDFLYYIDGNLVGYLALFTFKIDEAELSAVVHPKYRRRGIFKALLREATLELSIRNISKALIICPQPSTFVINRLQTLGANYIYSQIEMCANKEPTSKALPEIQLRLANNDDIMTLAKIGSVSFNTPLMEVLQRFIENSRDKKRKAWLLVVNNENIGKIHVRYEDNRSAFIHDLCILPEHRGKNYATAMILATMDLLRKESYKNITLDVEYHNKGALKLYEQCGFVGTAIHEFWQIEINKLVN